MNTEDAEASTSSLPMELSEYSRYGRQMILPGFGLEAQLKLRASKVLVIGAGGLGCPAIQYLAAAGVGHITVVDHDVVETSNLARQILHTDDRVSVPKAESAAIAARAINPHITLTPLISQLHAQNAQSLISTQDLVLDCTDNVLTRYLISDAAVQAGVQVVSGAAQGFEGQLIVLNKILDDEFASSVAAEGKKRKERGPCYRCLFPKAPRPEDVTDCAEGGVLGGVTGLVGTMQALEAVKLLTGVGEATPASMTLVSPLSFPPFRSVKLRPRKAASCRACGDAELVGAENMIRELASEDYVSFCGLDRETKRDEVAGISVQDLSSRLQAGQTCVLDVRPSIEYGITQLPNSINVPFTTIRRDAEAALSTLRSQVPAATETVYVLCRRGNDSVSTVSMLQSATGSDEAEAKLRFVDVKGGLVAWCRDVDPKMPVY